MNQPATTTYQDLIAWSAPGGGAFVTMNYPLQPANGVSTVKPQTVPGSGESVYIDGVRYIDGEAMHIYSLDSAASHTNRQEELWSQAVKGDNPEDEKFNALLRRINRVSVSFADPHDPDTSIDLLDVDMPGRVFDMLIRTAQPADRPGNFVDKDPRYLKVRTAYPEDATALAALSPVTVLYGGWDSITPAGNKVPSLVTGETIGVDADQTRDAEGRFIGSRNQRGGMRNDVFARTYSHELAEYLAQLGKDGEIDILPRLHAGAKKAAAKAGGKSARGSRDKTDAESAEASAISEYLLGSIVVGGKKGAGPSPLGGVACSKIFRTTTIDLPNIRRLRFVGRSAVEQAQARAAFIALGLLLDARVAENLVFRSGTVLGRSHGADTMRFVASDGAETVTAPLHSQQAMELLGEAIDNVPWLWDGSVLRCTGDQKFAQLARKDSQNGEDGDKSGEGSGQ